MDTHTDSPRQHSPHTASTPMTVSNGPPAQKWIQDNEESDGEVGLVPHNRGYKLKWASSDRQFGGNKLRAPRSLAEEAEFTKAGKTRMVVKRKRRQLDELSEEEEEDPYTHINIEDILSPIESPTDIVRRASLARILKSRQIELLAGTAMDFIESEKNFNKTLCRLSAIMHNDDPRYLDLPFDAPTDVALSDAQPGEDTPSDDPVKQARELLLENINYSNEYLARLQEARDKLCKAYMQKEALWKQLKANAKEEDKRPRYN